MARLWWAWCFALVVAAVVRTQTVADLVSFDLSRGGGVELTLGAPGQVVEVLAGFYASGVAVRVSNCLAGGGWNPIVQPWDGVVVDTDGGDGGLVGMQLVKWRASPGARLVNVGLRKGGKNVTVIELGILNDGVYPWDANWTFTQGRLEPGDDYSIMLWTDSPPRLSVSGDFTMGPHPNSTGTSGSGGGGGGGVIGAVEAECVRKLKSHEGYYNESLDGEYVAGIGTTRVIWTTETPGGPFRLENAPVGVVSESELGWGMVGLSALQRARNSRVPEMDVVGLYIGDGGGRNGSVVMGGYDDNLIDRSQKAVFTKANANSEGFEVSLSNIVFIGAARSGRKETRVFQRLADPPKVPLMYEEFGLRLTKEMLDALLPLIGSPVFDGDVNGFIYSGVPTVDFSLRFTMGNGSSEVSITVPGSALLTTDSSEDNPITPRTECGKTYLRISEDTHPSLGRAFLQYVYLINAPSTISKFHLSALRSPFPKSKSLIPASRTSISIFNCGGTTPAGEKTPAVAPMVSGILGGIAVLILAATTFIFIQRRRRRRVQEQCHGSQPRSVCFPGHPPPFEKHTSLGEYEKELGSIAMTPPLPLLPARRRQSEISTVARVVSEPPSPPSPPLLTPQRVAAIGKFYSGASTVDPKSPIGKTPHVRTASIGRVVSPMSVEFVEGSVGGRRSSAVVVGGRKSVYMPKEGSPSDDAASSVFGLEAVAKDGEFLEGGSGTYLDDNSSAGSEYGGDEDRILQSQGGGGVK